MAMPGEKDSAPLSATTASTSYAPILTTFDKIRRESEGTLADLWGPALGCGPRNSNDPIIKAYRLAVGVPDVVPSQPHPSTIEEGSTHHHIQPAIEERRRNAVGIYRTVLVAQRNKQLLYRAINGSQYFFHVAQVVIGAVLTALAPSAGDHTGAITFFAIANTCIATVLALIQGQNLPDRYCRAEIEFRKVRDFIEETEALLLAGICGRDLQDVGRLVETTFKICHNAKLIEEDSSSGSFAHHGMPGGKAGSSGRY